MPELTLVKTNSGAWAGLSSEDVDLYRRFKKWRAKREPGEFFTMFYEYERNQGHHKKFMTLVDYVAANSDTYDNKAKAMHAIKIAAGHCDFVMNPITGELGAVPRSINFKTMKQGAFEEFYVNAVQGVIKHILPHMNKVDMQTALEEIARY